MILLNKNVTLKYNWVYIICIWEEYLKLYKCMQIISIR